MTNALYVAARSVFGDGYWAARAFSIKLIRKIALAFCFDALFNPKSASHFSESALERDPIKWLPLFG